MTYEKPTIEVVGNAQALVLGTKNLSPYQDAFPSTQMHSLLAYESDE